MNKSIIKGVLAFAIILILCLGIYLLLNNKENKTNENIINNSNNKNNNKTLVVYFSAQGHTEDVAKKIANNLNADIFKIEPKEEYTSSDLDWTDNNSRVTKEHNNEALRNIELKTTKVDNFDSYDTIIIGYPIWWGIAAWPINNFVKENDFTDKTVIPFCTSASSSIGNSDKLLKELSNTGNWIDGYRFNSNPSNDEINKFINNIK